METPTTEISSPDIVDSGHFFEVRLENFDGPIDLLLHLVKRQELPIEKLSLFQITSQYFECLSRMKHLDLEVAGEYLVIASTLLSIKSSILLNEPVELIPDDEGNLIDPHQELLDRIREAAIYKDGAMHLSERDLLGLDVFANLAILKTVDSPPARYKDHDPLLLARAFRKMISQAKDAGPMFSITVDTVSIVERMMGILDLLAKSDGMLSFEAVIVDPTDRGSVISGFLALLELCKRGAIAVRQNENFEDISIVLAEVGYGDASHSQANFTSEFDEENEFNEMSEDDEKASVNE